MLLSFNACSNRFFSWSHGLTCFQPVSIGLSFPYIFTPLPFMVTRLDAFPTACSLYTRLYVSHVCPLGFLSCSHVQLSFNWCLVNSPPHHFAGEIRHLSSSTTIAFPQILWLQDTPIPGRCKSHGSIKIAITCPQCLLAKFDSGPRGFRHGCGGGLSAHADWLRTIVGPTTLTHTCYYLTWYLLCLPFTASTMRFLSSLDPLTFHLYITPNEP